MKPIPALALAIAGMYAVRAANPVPQFKDHQEYNLVGAIELERDPARRVSLLERWSELYPGSEFRQERWNQLITAERALGHPRKMRDIARRMVADDPTGFGNYWLIVLTINLQDSSPRALDEGRRAANDIVRNAGRNFSRANCPSSVGIGAWYQERDRQVALAHRTLGWVALQQKRYGEAIAELSKVTGGNPSDAEAQFWLGSALLGQGKPELQEEALQHFARALTISGKNALSPEAHRLVQPYFTRAYIAWNGSGKGLPDFLQQAAAGSKR